MMRPATWGSISHTPTAVWVACSCGQDHHVEGGVLEPHAGITVVHHRHTAATHARMLHAPPAAARPPRGGGAARRRRSRGRGPEIPARHRGRYDREVSPQRRPPPLAAEQGGDRAVVHRTKIDESWPRGEATRGGSTWHLAAPSSTHEVERVLRVGASCVERDDEVPRRHLLQRGRGRQVGERVEVVHHAGQVQGRVRVERFRKLSPWYRGSSPPGSRPQSEKAARRRPDAGGRTSRASRSRTGR